MNQKHLVDNTNPNSSKNIVLSNEQISFGVKIWTSLNQRDGYFVGFIYKSLELTKNYYHTSVNNPI
jgi:hypothetical protein